MDSRLIRLLEIALSKRAVLFEDSRTNAFRLFNSAADGVRGLVIEQLAEVLIVQLHEGQLMDDEGEVRLALSWLRDRLGARAVYKKIFVRDRGQAPDAVALAHNDPHPWLGEPVESAMTVRENGLLFRVRPYDGFSVGLFLEHRENRRRIRELSSGRSVLNAFSYTGGFSVAAAAGGARAVASVDLSRRYLEWSRENLSLNGVDPGSHRFFCSDLFEFYRRSARQKRLYDLIILDPPTFSRLRRPDRVFVLSERLDELVAGAMMLLETGGLIFLSTNDRQITISRLEVAIRTNSHGRKCTVIARPALPLDFEGDPDYSRSIIVRCDV